MKIYTIPSDLSKDICIKDVSETCINDPLMKKISETKCKLDNNIHLWDKAKKHINDYEYIYTSSQINKNISSICPVSRSFFKMREIVGDFNINVNGRIACIAEAPGGFIQCLRGYSETIESIHGITLISDNKDVPFWNINLIKDEIITTHSGKDETGDIYNIMNMLEFIKDVGKNTCTIVTSDGGFDYSGNFNDQELSSYKLIRNEIFMALNLQKTNGTFICKIFDIFYYSTIQLLYLLYLSYNSVSFIKPYTSRPSNSEKYIVCRGFKGYNKDISNLLCSNLDNSILPIQVPDDFIKVLNNYNETFIGLQDKFITNGINLVRRRNISHHKPTEKQLQKAKDWCKKYKIPINNSCMYLN